MGLLSSVNLLNIVKFKAAKINRADSHHDHANIYIKVALNISPFV